MKRLLISIYLAGSLALVTSAGAADESNGVLPEAQVQNGIAYLTGGVGLDEREAMQSVQHDYNLWLSFARKGDAAYAADTLVAIHDVQGKLLLKVFAEGPWLMVKLAPGQYRVTARHEYGSATTQRVTVSGKATTRHVMQIRESAEG